MTETNPSVPNRLSTRTEVDGIEMSVERLSKSFTLPADMSPHEVDLFIPKASKDAAFLAAVEEEVASIPTQRDSVAPDC